MPHSPELPRTNETEPPLKSRPSTIWFEGEVLVCFCCAGERDAVNKQLKAQDKMVRIMMRNPRKMRFA
jgi:hypothetical protein